MIKVGQKVSFDPFKGINTYGFTSQRRKVTGTVAEVHEDHHWFGVEYEIDGVKQRTSFNFADVGVSVDIRK